MNFFGWDLGFLTPLHFLEVYLANGVLFEGEKKETISKTKKTAEEISERCYEILDEIIRQSDSFKNIGYRADQVASTIIYLARQDVLNLNRSRHVWPKGLQLITRLSEREVKKIA